MFTISNELALFTVISILILVFYKFVIHCIRLYIDDDDDKK